MKELTWKCHICKVERPDNKIAVMTKPIKGLSGSTMNLRFCSDKRECIEGAKKWQVTTDE